MVSEPVRDVWWRKEITEDLEELQDGINAERKKIEQKKAYGRIGIAGDWESADFERCFENARQCARKSADVYSINDVKKTVLGKMLFILYL